MGYERFKIGAVEFPLTAVLSDPEVTLDAPIASLLDYYEFELTRNLLPYWQVLLPTIGLSEYADNVVAEKISYDPELYFQEAQYKLPLLAVFRTSETRKEKTVNRDVWTVNVKFRYILPTLTAAQNLSMVQILKAIRAIIADRTEQGYDPAYTDGYGAVLQPMEDAGIARIAIKEALYGHLVNPQTNLTFPVLDLDIELEELQLLASGFEDLEGLDGTIQIAQAGSTDAVDVIEFEQDF